MGKQSASKRGSVLGALGGAAVLLLLIGADWLAFRYLAHENYFLWYLKNGTLIAILVSFLALIWEGLNARDDLLSAHPGYYLLGCIALMSAFYWSLASHLARPPRGAPKSRQPARPEFAFSPDNGLAFIMLIMVAILGLGWLLVVAPLNYFVTLLTGSIARQTLAGIGKRAIALQLQGQAVPNYMSLGWDEELPPYGATDITLAAKPFALTQALTALVIFIAKAAAGV